MSQLLALISVVALQAGPQGGTGESYEQARARGVEALLAARLDQAIEAFEHCLGLQARLIDPGNLAYNLACAYSRKGDTSAALDWLERCIALGWIDLPGEVDWISMDVDLDPLRQDARYEPLLKAARQAAPSVKVDNPRLPPTYLDWNGGYPVIGGSPEFSPDGRRVASPVGGGWVCIWDSTSGEPLLKLLHPGEVKLCSWIDSGRQIVTGASDQTLRFLDARTGELLRSCSGPRFHVSAPALSPDGHWIASTDGPSVRLVDILSIRGRRLHLGSTIHGTAFSPDSSLFATACADGTTRLFRASDGSLRRTHRSAVAVFDAAFSTDGRWLVTAGADGLLHWLDAVTLEPARSLQAHSAEINRVRFRPGGADLLTAGVDRTARVWSAESGSLRFTMTGHEDEVTWAVYSPDGRRILTRGGYDGTTRIWDADTGEPLLHLVGRKELQHRSLSYSPDGSRLVVYDDRRARELDTTTGGELELSAQRHVVSVRRGRGGLPHTVPCQRSTWNEAPALLQIEGVGVDIDAVLLSADQQTIHTADSDDHGRLWNAKTGRLVRDLGPLSRDGELTRNCGRWSSACFSPDGALLATTQHADGATHLWETSTGENLMSIQGGHSFSNAAEFDSSGELLAIARGDWSVEVWSSYSRDRVHSFKASAWPKFIAFQPGGTLLASGNYNGQIQLWDLGKNACIRVLQPLLATNVCGVSFSLDGKRLASSAGDHRIMIWDVESGSLLGTIVLSEELGDWLAFAPSGHYQGTSEAIARARLVQGAVPYPLSCFAAALENPAQVAASFAGVDVDTPVLPSPPTLVVDTPRERTSVVEERSVHLRAMATEPLAGLSGIEVTQDGVSLAADVFAKSLTLQDNERLARLELRLPFPAGTDETRITLQAVSARGIKSRPESLVVRYEPPRRELYVLALGVADYAGDQLDLACPVQDVDGLVQRLQGQEELFHAVRIERRVDRDVTPAEVLRLREEFLLQAKPDDTLVVFVAGHGVRTDSGEYWFLTSDATPQRPYSGIKRADLESLVTWDKLHATKRVLLLDTCHSGAAFGQGTRGERGIAFQQSEVDTLLERSSGLYILAATSDEGFAREQEGNGLFTRALLDGLDGAADSGDFGDKDGTVGIDELMHFARYAVLERSAGRQQPTFPRIEGGENFPLARVGAASAR